MTWNERSRKMAPGARVIRMWQCLIALAAAWLVAMFAFGQLFTTFVPWDDEGYFLQANRDFLSGHALYDQVFAMYGPLTFFSSALLARFNVLNVTHDSFRWIVLPVWIVIAALMARVVWNLTRQFTPSLATFLLVGFRLSGLAKAVGHPQLWIILAVAFLLWLGADEGSTAKRKKRAFWTGVILGTIFLFKINIAVFVSIGFLLSVSLRLKGRPRVLACGILITAASGIGIALLFANPTTPERCFALAYLASIVATIGIAIRRPVEQEASVASLMWLAAGLALCLCIGGAGTLASGTTLKGLYKAYITAPALFARSYHNAFSDSMRKSSILICAIGLVTALGVFGWRSWTEARPVWLGLLKVAAGGGLLCAFCYDPRLTVTGSLLFLWLLIVDVPPMSGPAYSNRLLLALLSAFLSLQLFPMAGEQVDWAALMPMTAAAVLLADGMNCIARESYHAALPRFAGFATGAAGILLTIYLFVLVGENTFERWRQWQNSQPLNLPGAHWLRLPPGETARLKSAVSQLSQNCQTVLTVPGLYSFSLWSGVPPAEDRRINIWPYLWPDEVQKTELRSLRRQNQGCVLVSGDVYGFLKRFAVSPSNDELLSEIQRTMNRIYTVQDITLYRSLR